MTYDEAVNLVLDAAVETWARNTKRQDLGRAINLVEAVRRDAEADLADEITRQRAQRVVREKVKERVASHSGQLP